ncbi:MAG: type II toxin-antitoxin system HicB family antitoxin [Candidatus Eremiobacteraeota bacterium]|nr:type II toxin-antitoxin system HicB family antitoxin [Candidatus Eremiobacteraeota bacterium]
MSCTLRHCDDTASWEGHVMLKHFNVLLEWDEEDKVFISYVPALNNISTYGDTREEALANTREAIMGYIEAAQKEGIPVKEDQGSLEWVNLEIAV